MMPQRTTTPTAFAILAIALAACGGSAERDAAGDAGDATPASTASVPTPGEEGAVNSEITLEVTGGPHAGRYTAQVTEGGCSYGFAEKGAWGNQYSVDTQDAKKFSSLQLIVPDSKSAAGGTGRFLMTVSFGPLFSGGTSYEISTRKPGEAKGSGTVKVDDRGGSGTVSFDGKTADGIGLKGTIECHTLMRAE